MVFIPNEYKPDFYPEENGSSPRSKSAKAKTIN
jgi:hypothetical protein